MTSSTGHEDLLFVDSVVTVSEPELLDPPESTSSEIDSDEAVSPIPEAPRLRSAVLEGADESGMLMTMPKVVRTYTRKITRESPVRKDGHTSSPSQFFVHERTLLDRPLDDASDKPIKLLASLKTRRRKDTKKRISAVPQKRRQQLLRDDGEESCQEDSIKDGVDRVVSWDSKTRPKKRKKRRAPVNQLALVARAPSHEDSGVSSQVGTSLWHDRLLWVSIIHCVKATC